MSQALQKVLCTVDFSNPSIQALKWAVKFSRDIGCELAILYSYRLTGRMNEDIISSKKKMEQEALRHFTDFENEYLKNISLTYEFKVEIGFIADRIEDFAKNNTLSFIVMDKALCMRSRDTFDELLEQTNVPLIIIP